MSFYKFYCKILICSSSYISKSNRKILVRKSSHILLFIEN
ncbi:hypothetical protein G436_1078 [Leptospira interrogans serovar Hardjo str. Norma]|uniref:Uncharacterized protein n=1 Tax=Leptospira interrogans serovar Hardjo str. Norma TaxID=1279460 RepID=A0A0M5L8K4_LEPIR|nr:hypothetical protein G436_1078 [Leptospira interrogans serovar Hardjo str. Norma]EKO96771.1 hypothetical protein LEP1GSC057_3704 [Leptospira interrogans str. Brem 329]